MSGIGGSCGCVSGCKCGIGCGGTKMNPDMSHAEKSATETVVMGVAPEKSHSEISVGAENNGKCKCGDNCQCNPCNCK